MYVNDVHVSVLLCAAVIVRYGIQCLPYFLHAPNGEAVKPDVIMFNWGLHDGPLGNTTVPGQAGLPDVYAAQLENITTMLQASVRAI